MTSGVRQWSVKAAGEDTLLALNQAGTVRVHTDPETGQIRLSTDERTFHVPALEYDPILREWAGSEFDSEIVQPPGEKRAPKAALVALTECIVRLLDSPSYTASS